jgi:hypothetical protein
MDWRIKKKLQKVGAALDKPWQIGETGIGREYALLSREWEYIEQGIVADG